VKAPRKRLFTAALAVPQPSRIILYSEEKMGILFTATIGPFLASLSICFMMISASGRQPVTE
jgi:hypothetical protein